MLAGKSHPFGNSGILNCHVRLLECLFVLFFDGGGLCLLNENRKMFFTRLEDLVVLFVWGVFF